jgi:carbon-monoxide dehydrogenase medium subunit
LKLPAVGYQQAESVEHAVRLLVESDGDGKILAGGQSLIPMMAYRLLAPSILIDIGRIAELKSIELGPSELKIGALVRWCDVLESRDIAATHPLLREAISHVAHVQIRNRGTIGGSLAHCDPAAECPATVLALDGVIDIAGPNGQRSMPADGFFQGLLSTDLSADEIITACRFGHLSGDGHFRNFRAGRAILRSQACVCISRSMTESLRRPASSGSG